MKKKFLTTICIVITGCILNTSCIGSFTLFNKLADWNTGATEDKFLDAVIGFFLSPAYAVCLFADWTVLNTIEFWSGTSPLAAGQMERRVGTNGDVYLVTTEKDGYTILNETRNDSIKLVYNQTENTWSMKQNGEVKNMMTFNKNNTITVYTSGNQQIIVNKNKEGLKQVQEIAGNY